MSDTQWAEEKMLELGTMLPAVIAAGDDKKAGVLAGRMVCFANAVSRVQKGRSIDLVNDPLYGRSMNIAEYFNNPRVATPEDDLGSIHDWSI